MLLMRAGDTLASCSKINFPQMPHIYRSPRKEQKAGMRELAGSSGRGCQRSAPFGRLSHIRSHKVSGILWMNIGTITPNAKSLGANVAHDDVVKTLFGKPRGHFRRFMTMLIER